MEYRARPNARSKEYLIIVHVTRHVWEAPAAIFWFIYRLEGRWREWNGDRRGPLVRYFVKFTRASRCAIIIIIIIMEARFSRNARGRVSYLRVGARAAPRLQAWCNHLVARCRP